MNFKVSSSALYSRLTAANKVMGSKNSMPILDCFLFDVKGGNITITASDGLVLHGLYADNNDPKALVQIMHGMAEHKERYEKLINKLI